ncbi:hypothetical protein T8K17_13325 [Thalassobaculum sp. OXR-137]|uniref:hypothetical protein n=1 Tax=Thalassobaculum sp. OXR-137 TaxID=3100173 RepID=UPI002AC91FA5|nr:hypothetical protein [Thalassobaculum sp. OXR-137]WPZ32223.1 hypothetical protein T8K17_13325 [Thalassobaculum sp. OXR-137]
MTIINIIERQTKTLQQDVDRLDALADTATRALHAGDTDRYRELVEAYRTILENAADQIESIAFLARRATPGAS